MEAEHRYASVEQVYGPGHLPDTICAMALAWEAAHSYWEAGESPRHPTAVPPEEMGGNVFDETDFLLGYPR